MAAVSAAVGASGLVTHDPPPVYGPKTTTTHTVEDTVRSYLETNRVRLKGNFRDFDPLRTGFVTTPQFFRTLTLVCRQQFDESQVEYLVSKYGRQIQGRMNYAAFLEAIARKFDPNLLTVDPCRQGGTAYELLGTERSVQKLDPESEAHLENILTRMNSYYTNRGLVFHQAFVDFDRHHRGVVTESQFYRSFPGPSDIAMDEITLLVKKYGDPDRPGLVNYLNIMNDLLALKELEEKPEKGFNPQDMSYYLDKDKTDPPLQEILDNLRAATFKMQIRSGDFFKDYDRLRHGVITDNQFVIGLTMAYGKENVLSRADMQKLVEHYRVDDRHVRYREFCDMMEHAFNVPHLEKKPLQEMHRPARGALNRPFVTPDLTDAEKLEGERILTDICYRVRSRRLMMYPYFKDFDRGESYTRIVTASQFGRILTFLSINVNPNDFNLLCKMFRHGKDDVNYPAFVQAVDTDFSASKVDDEAATGAGACKEQGAGDAPPGHQMYHREKDATTAFLTSVNREQGEQENLDDLMARIRHIVMAKRTRVKPCFEDFDPLKTGYVSLGQFRRGLASLGLSKLGEHDLTDPQFFKLYLYYRDPQNTDKVRWRDFCTDIEGVFVQPNLEKTPSHQVPSPEVFQVPKPGTMDWRFASDDHRDLVDTVMNRLRQKVQQRRILCLPVFQDFDRHRHRHVTRKQFRQALTILELPAAVAELDAMEAKFCDDAGVNYGWFLDELEGKEQPKLMYLERAENLRKINEKKGLPELNPATDLEDVLEKIKIKVCKQRIRMIDFLKDYDKLNHGRLNKVSYRRGLKLSGIELTQSELAILEDYYEFPADLEQVDYRRFCDDIEAIFTLKNMEKKPLEEPVPFQPPDERRANQLSADGETVLAGAIARLAGRVGKTRMQLFPLMEDFDRVHCGAVSRGQFRRTLSELTLDSLLTDQEYLALYHKFLVKVGGRDDVNYVDFCRAVYEAAGIQWNRP